MGDKVNGEKIKTQTIVCDLHHDVGELAEKLRFDFVTFIKLVHPGSIVELISGINGEAGAVYQMIDVRGAETRRKRRKNQHIALFTFQSVEWIRETEFKLCYNARVGDFEYCTTTLQLLKTGPNKTTFVLKNYLKRRPHRTSEGCISACRGVLWLYLLGPFVLLFKCKRQDYEEGRLIPGIHAFFASPEYGAANKSQQAIYPHTTADVLPF